jgi:hypothetical protein
MYQNALPWYAKTSLAVVALLSLPNYIGLLTKTKVWCAITGRCEVGGANYADLSVGAVFTTIILLVFFYVVFGRKRVLLVFLGVAQLISVALTAFSFVTKLVMDSTPVSTIDVLLLSSVAFVGSAFVVFGVRLFRNQTQTTTTVPAGG